MGSGLFDCVNTNGLIASLDCSSLSSYRASGTGGYDGYVGCPIVREIGTEMSDLLLDYFKRYGGELPLARGEFRVF